MDLESSRSAWAAWEAMQSRIDPSAPMLVHGMESDAHVHAPVMEPVDGEDLSARLAGGLVPVGEAIVAAQRIADALEAAHEHGMIHRALKPHGSGPYWMGPGGRSIGRSACLGSPGGFV